MMPPARDADLEPAGRTVEGTLSWQHRTGFSLLENFATPFYGYNIVAGIKWDCPSCQVPSAVELRFRQATYSFFCCNCRWKRSYNHLYAQQLLAEFELPLTP